MDGLFLLRLYADHASAVSFTTTPSSNALRFVMEYREPPDLAVERHAIGIGLGTHNIQITALFSGTDGESSRFLLLSIPGTERPAQTAPLFTMAHALRELRGLVVCTPDIGPDLGPGRWLDRSDFSLTPPPVDIAGAPACLADADGVTGLLSKVMGDAPTPPPPGGDNFDWTVHGLEVTHLLLSNARSPQEASALLVAAAAGSADPRLRRLVERRPCAIMPKLHERPPAPELAPEQGLTILARPRASGLESAAPLTLEAVRAHLTAQGVRSRLDLAEKVFRHRAARDADAVDAALQDQVLSTGEEVLTRFARTGELPPAAGIGRLAFEALVLLTGRPALRVENGFLDLAAPEVENWLTALEIGKAEIERVLPSVGRIDRNGAHVGTGFVIAPDLIMTNRHVLEEVAFPIPTPHSPELWALRTANTTIDFSPDQDVEQSPFRIKGVVFAGPDPIEEEVNFSHLDLAILEVETTDAAGRPLPPPLALSAAGARASSGRHLYVVGYPAQPDVPLGDFNGTDRGAIVEKLRQLFGLRYGRKYFSPGRVSLAPGVNPQDAGRWVFGHDATTLGGNSGSCVLYFGDPMAVIGLHFAGDWMRNNYAHSLAALRERLGDVLPGGSPMVWR